MKYLCDPHIVPTNTCPPDFSELSRRTEQFLSFAPEMQIDIADGVFAPATSWPFSHGQWQELESLVTEGRKLPFADTVLYEAHMMVSDPRMLGALLSRAGCKRLIYHVESVASDDAKAMILEWKDAGAQEVGVALRIDTPLEHIDEVVGDCDFVQLMSIAQIGSQGQPFDERAVTRVEEIHATYPDLLVAVDGGISESNVELLVRAGANRLCVGSAISKAADPAAAYASLHTRAMRGCAPLSVSPQAV